MSRLFNRTVELSVTQPTETGFFEYSSTTTTIADLRVSFAIEKHLGKEPNTCEVHVFNLAERSRALFQTKPLHVRLAAGFDGNAQRLFAGDLTWSQSKHTGVEWETTLQLGDGARAFRNARLSKSFKRGITARQAASELIKQFGLPVPAAVRDAPELGAQYAGGLVLTDAAHLELTRVLAPYGLTWSIQDGRIQVLRERDVRSDVPVEISQDTGMIGTPELAAPEKKGKPPTLTVQTLLYPSLTPGGRIDVRARQIKGIFKIQRLRHTGDSHGDEWQTEIEATPV